MGLLLLLGSSGCAAQREANERRLHALQDQVDLLESANDRLEARIGALELASRKASAPTAPRASSERPPLDVVKLAPEGDAVSAPTPSPAAAAAPDESAPRLLIRGTGDRVEAQDPGPTSRLDRARCGARASEPPWGPGGCGGWVPSRSYPSEGHEGEGIWS